MSRSALDKCDKHRLVLVGKRGRWTLYEKKFALGKV